MQNLRTWLHRGGDDPTESRGFGATKGGIKLVQTVGEATDILRPAAFCKVFVQGCVGTAWVAGKVTNVARVWQGYITHLKRGFHRWKGLNGTILSLGGRGWQLVRG